MKNSNDSPGLLSSLIPVIFLMLLLGLNVWLYESDSSYGPNQIALILAGALAALLALKNGTKWETLQDGIINSIQSSMTAILILLLIGALAGTWMISGIVPALIFYGLKVLNPDIFLFAACVSCALVSTATGSSWSTVATIGIALLGIGNAMNFNEGLVAGAIISGAYFGDKLSPLSDTTNLAPSVAGTDLFTHIRYMLYTTIPSMVITLILFLILGFLHSSAPQEANINDVLQALSSRFFIHPILFIVPLLVILMIVKKVPTIPVLLIGSLLGGIMAIIFQPNTVSRIGGEHINYAQSAYIAINNALFGEIQLTTGNAITDNLLHSRGMSGMLNTVWLILSAMVFGGIMEQGKFLQTITQSIIRLAHSTGSLIASTAGTCLFFNLTASDQYLSIIVTGKMFSKTYQDRNLAPENLSRTLEDAGTVTSVLVPWNTCGATQASVLGVPTLVFAPYCFFNIISPFMSIIFGYLNIKIRKIKL